jgi:hypothetical protein
MTTTPEQLKQGVKAAVAVVFALSEAIRELGEVPAGNLYTRLQDKISLEVFERSVDLLVSAKLVRRDASHLLVWVGPSKEPLQPQPLPLKHSAR